MNNKLEIKGNKNMCTLQSRFDVDDFDAPIVSFLDPTSILSVEFSN